eukprot:scaffold58_cov256-Pinguiococcus_pyrenoidosus.AAC.16
MDLTELHAVPHPRVSTPLSNCTECPSTLRLSRRADASEGRLEGRDRAEESLRASAEHPALDSSEEQPVELQVMTLKILNRWCWLHPGSQIRPAPQIQTLRRLESSCCA